MGERFNFRKIHLQQSVVKRWLAYLFVFSIIGSWCTSCNTTRFLNEDQQLLKGNKIVLTDAKDVKNKSSVTYQLENLIKQKENGHVLFGFLIPREYVYFKNTEPGDTSKFAAWMARVNGEQPAIYQEDLKTKSEEAMKYFMDYRGFFDAEVYTDKLEGKKKPTIKLSYHVAAGPQYQIDTVIYTSTDPGIDSLLQQSRKSALMQPKSPLNLLNYDAERERITSMLRNRGYAYFYPNYFSNLEIDTFNTSAAKHANVYINIDISEEDTLVRPYNIGSITVLADFNPSGNSITIDTTVSGVDFIYHEDRGLPIKLNTLLNQIKMRPGELFRQADYDLTNLGLSSLNVFSFVRIRQHIDPLYPDKINIRIELTPTDFFSIGSDFDISYTNRTSTTLAPTLIGLSVSPNARHRNFFGGAETFLANASAGVELAPNNLGVSSPRLINTVDLRLQAEVQFPKFMDYLSTWKALNRKRFGKRFGILDDRSYNLVKNNAKSRFALSYNYVDILDFYRYNLINASFGYDVQHSGTHRLIINHIGIDYLDPTTEEEFQKIQNRNPFLERSFGRQFFVSLLFRDFNLIYRSKVKPNGRSKYVGFNVEMAGGEIFLANTIYNNFALKPSTFQIGKSEFSQYLLSSLDLRWYGRATKTRSWASRVSLGIGSPFGFTSDLPYVKQFFAGGPNSIRAWPQRGIGPGGFIDSLSNTSENTAILYQTGDLQLEANMEYRFKLFSYLRGAFFIDAGNVWTIRPDSNRCGSQFLLQRRTYEEGACLNARPDTHNDPFYKQIAIGAGVGFRLDVNYFLLRLDMGLPLRNPYPEPGSRNAQGIAPESAYWVKYSRVRLRDFSLNLGLGYPF